MGGGGFVQLRRRTDLFHRTVHPDLCRLRDIILADLDHRPSLCIHLTLLLATFVVFLSIVATRHHRSHQVPRKRIVKLSRMTVVIAASPRLPLLLVLVVLVLPLQPRDLSRLGSNEVLHRRSQVERDKRVVARIGV
jgi:hypothetical protein